MKHQVPKIMRSYVVHWFCCPGCEAIYMCKTERNLYIRLEEHACSDKESFVYNQLLNCSNYEHIKSCFCSNNDLFNIGKFNLHSVLQHIEIINLAIIWSILLIKDALNTNIKTLGKHKQEVGDNLGICVLNLQIV